jgi:hypothetical protein
VEFEIPEASSLPRFTVQALKDLGLEAAAAYDALREALTPETATDEDVDDLEDLKSFMVLVDDELSTRKDRLARFNALPATVKAADEEDGETDDGEMAVASDESASENDAPTATKSKSKTKSASTTYAAETRTPSVAEIANSTQQNGVVEGMIETDEDN